MKINNISYQCNKENHDGCLFNTCECSCHLISVAILGAGGKIKQIIIFMVLSLLLAVPAVYAFDWDTHRWFAEQVCNNLNCPYPEDIINGSVVPDRDFKDFINHHYYNPNTCEESRYYDCPKKFDNITLIKADEWLKKAQNLEGKEKWHAIGIATHYWTDSKVIWHQVQNESYDECHSIFESKIGDKLKTDSREWKVSVCDQTVYYDDFDYWQSSLTTYIKQYISTDIQPYIPIFQVKTCGLFELFMDWVKVAFGGSGTCQGLKT